jgi:HSP20 family protein
MATQKQDEKQGNGGSNPQAITVQRGRPLAREQAPTVRRFARTRPFSLMRRMLDDLDPGTWASPFSTPMRRMFDDMERMFDTDFFSDLGGAREDVWAPRVEITQRGDKLVVCADLPGIPQDKIEISTEDNLLVIAGERAPSEAEGEVWRSERPYGRFRRVVALPDGIDAEKAEAHYDNGVLEVTLPFPAQARARRIEIQTSGKAEGGPSPQLEARSTQQQQQQQAEKH